MIYSRWRADGSGYDYFETPERRGLGDDLPVPYLPSSSPLGVASTDIGRALPANARPLGSGKLPRGMIAPLSRAGLSGVPDAVNVGVLLLAAAALLIIADSWFHQRRVAR